MIEIEDVINRYEEENSNIFQYVMYTLLSFAREKNVIVEGVTDHNNVREMLSQLDVNIMEAGEKEENNQHIVEKMKVIINDEKNKTSIYLDGNDKKQIPDSLQGLKIVSDELGLVEYLSHNYDNMNYDDYMKNLCNMTAASLKKEMDDSPGGETYYGKFTVDDYEKLLQYARIFHYNDHIEDVRYHERYLSEMLNGYHIMDYKHSLNIFRQAFILLLTAFDAAIFDIIEVIIRENFFDFIKANDDINESYKLKDIVQSGSFDMFQENIVAKILRNNYASGLLRMLRKFNKDYFVVNGEDLYKDICEIIARRNLHIHKKGIVDQGYCEQSQGNSYNLICGDVAYIKGSYYLNTMSTLLEFVKKFCVIDKVTN